MIHQRTQSVLSRRSLLCLAGAGAAFVALPGAALADDDALKSLLGTYRHAGGDAEREARDRAIEGVVSEMSIFSRGIARDKLKEGNPIAAKLALSATDASLTVALDKRSFTAPRDGKSVKVTTVTGDEMNMRFKLGKDLIEQVFFLDDRGKVNRFRPDGAKLVLNVRVHAKRLPKDLVYKLTYERV